MRPCSRCGKLSVIHVRYSGQHLCARHFEDFFERRFAKEARGPSKLRRGSKVAVAISGGKDSLVLLRLMRKRFHEKTGISLEAIIVDEGIKGYRAEGIRIAKRECMSLGIPLHVVTFKELFGTTIDEVAKLDPATIPCTYCGVFRRAALNRKAKEIGATILALGHNLDDVAGSIMMNYVRGDMERLARMGPHEKVQPGLVPRTLPLRLLPEEEVKLYSILEGMSVLERECPYAPRAQRGQFVKLLADLEDASPGTRHAIVSGYEGLKKALLQNYPPRTLATCPGCGEPAMGSRCKACEMAEALSGGRKPSARRYGRKR